MTDAVQETTDVVVIGSGIGGLTAAIILLKLGHRVMVVEKNNQPGGLMRSYDRKGISCPVGVHYVGALAGGQPLRRMFDYLGVTEKITPKRMGAGGIIDRYIFDDFEFNLPEGVDAFEQNLRSAFPSDQALIEQIMKNLREMVCQMDHLDDLLSPGRNLFMNEIFFTSVGGMLREMNCSPGLRSVMGMASSWIGVPLDECPVYYHHMALASYLLSSWICNGTQMADAFVGRTQESGGIIITGDPVEKVLVDARAVEGVVLKSGRVIRAATVVGAIHPKALLPLLPADAVRPAYSKRILHLQDTHGVFCANFLVNDQDKKEIPHNIFRVSTDAAGDVSDVVFYQLRAAKQPDVNLFTLITSVDPEAWRLWEDTRTGHRGRGYIEAKYSKANELLAAAANIFGPFKDFEFLDAYTHLTLRDWVHTPGGSAYGVLRSTRQLTSAAMLNRTSIQGLHMAGQSVLAPGVFGTTLGSFYAVRHIVGPGRFCRDVTLS